MIACRKTRRQRFFLLLVIGLLMLMVVACGRKSPPRLPDPAPIAAIVPGTGYGNQEMGQETGDRADATAGCHHSAQQSQATDRPV